MEAVVSVECDVQGLWKAVRVMVSEAVLTLIVHGHCSHCH